MRITLYRGTDQVIRLPRLRTSSPTEPLNSATVTGTLFDKNDVSVAEFTFNSDGEGLGTYEALVDGASFMLPVGVYTLAVVAVQGNRHYRTVCGVDIKD